MRSASASDGIVFGRNVLSQYGLVETGNTQMDTAPAFS
jgi:hypothetical protein